MAAKGGPSPLIPLLLVISLGLLLRSNYSFPIDLSSLAEISEAENAIFMSILCVPFLVALAIYSSSHSIVFPIALVLVTYTVSTVLLGPLMLILIVYLGGVWLPCYKCNGEELGWGCLLLLVFFLLQRGFSDEGGRLGGLLLALVIFFCYNFSS